MQLPDDLVDRGSHFFSSKGHRLNIGRVSSGAGATTAVNVGIPAEASRSVEVDDTVSIISPLLFEVASKILHVELALENNALFRVLLLSRSKLSLDCIATDRAYDATKDLAL